MGRGALFGGKISADAICGEWRGYEKVERLQNRPEEESK
jgi:hypothetical protein